MQRKGNHTRVATVVTTQHYTEADFRDARALDYILGDKPYGVTQSVPRGRQLSVVIPHGTIRSAWNFFGVIRLFARLAWDELGIKVAE